MYLQGKSAGVTTLRKSLQDNTYQLPTTGLEVRTLAALAALRTAKWKRISGRWDSVKFEIIPQGKFRRALSTLMWHV
jgi:hypothetical protein